MIEFRTLGLIDLRGRERPTPRGELNAVLAQGKRLALLAYLALARPLGPKRRDSLLAVFWPESTEARARNALNQSVYALRQLLGRNALMTVGTEALGVDSERIWCDGVAFRSAIDQGDAERALRLYRGPLLPGLHISDCPEFEKWLDVERADFQRTAVEAAVGLAEETLAQDNPVGASRWWTRASELAPHDETILRARLRLLFDLGDRAGAHRAYRALEEELSELGLSPTPETRTLLRELEDRGGDQPLEVASARTSESEEGGTAPEAAGFRAPEAESERSTGSTAVVVSNSGEAGNPVPSRWARVALLLGLPVLVGLTVFLGGRFLGGSGVADDAPEALARVEVEPRRVLLHSFVNRTGLDALDVIGELAAEWIALDLTRSGLVEAIPASLVREPTGDDREQSIGRHGRDPDEIALALRARAGLVVDGSFHRSGDRIVTEAAIVDVESGAFLRGVGPIEADLDESLDGLDLLRRRVSGALATVVDDRLRDWSGAASQPPSLEAYRLYAGGLDEYERLNFRAAEEMFMAAAALDSSFTAPLVWATKLPHLGNSEVDEMARVLLDRRDELAPWDRAMLDARLAEVRGDLSSAYEATVAVADLVPRSHWWLEAAELALRLNDPTTALEHLKRAAPHASDPIAPGRRRRMSAQALHRLERYEEELATVERSPGDSPGAELAVELRALAATGRGVEAESRLETLLRNRPWSRSLAEFARTVASELRAHGDSAAEQRILARLLASYDAAPESFWERRERYVPYGRTLAAAGRLSEARVVFTDLLRDGVLPEVVRGDLGVLAGRLGEREEAERLASWFAAEAERWGTHGGGWYKQWEARIVASLGERRRAVELLRHAFEKGWSHILQDHRERDYDLLRGYPPFERLMQPRRLH